LPSGTLRKDHQPRTDNIYVFAIEGYEKLKHLFLNTAIGILAKLNLSTMKSPTYVLQAKIIGLVEV